MKKKRFKNMTLGDHVIKHFFFFYQLQIIYPLKIFSAKLMQSLKVNPLE